MNTQRQAIAAAFARQARLCAATAAPVCSELLRRCTDDILRNGPIGALVADFAGDPAKGALPLRLLGALHAQALRGDAPQLAAHLPSTGGTPRWPAAFDAFVAAATQHADEVRRWLEHPPQTNEVGRSAAFAAGYLSIAAAAGAASPLPLHLRELGASAGLNLRWDRYALHLGGRSLGDAGSPVQLRPRWLGPPPPAAQLAVSSRRGCDLRPVDVRDAMARARLPAYVWADHADRAATMRAALELARGDDLVVEAADAADWLEQVLAEPPPAGATVVQHSSLWSYLDAATQRRIERLLDSAGARRTAAASLHWLRWEDPPGTDHHELRVRSWPGGRERLLASGQPHGRSIEWLAATGA